MNIVKWARTNFRIYSLVTLVSKVLLISLKCEIGLISLIGEYSKMGLNKYPNIFTGVTGIKGITNITEL